MLDFSKLLDSTIVSAQNQQTNIARRQEAERIAESKRQELNRAGTQQSLDLVQGAFKSSTKTRGAQLEILANVQATTDIAREAMRLSDSDNPMDRLQLWFMQQGDDRYTREGNTNRLNYLRTASAMTGLSDVIRQEQLTAELNQIQLGIAAELEGDNDALTMLKLNEAQGEERLNANEMMLKLAESQLNDDLRIKNEALDRVGLDDLQSAIQEATANNDSTVEIGNGVRVSVLEARDRHTALQQRSQVDWMLEKTADENTLSTLNSTQLTDLLATQRDGHVDVNGRRIPVNTVKTALIQANDTTGQLASQRIRDEQQYQIMQQQYIAGMSQTEVTKAIADEGMLPNGMKASMEDLLNRQTQAREESQLISGREMTTMSQRTPEYQLSQAIGIIDSARQMPMASNPAIASALDEYRSNVLRLENLINEDSDDPDAQLAAAVQANAMAQQKVESLARTEAQRLAPNNDALALAYEHQLKGELIPTSIIVEELSNLSQKGRSLAAWLNPAAVSQFTQAYRESQTVTSLNQEDLSTSQRHAIAFNEGLMALKNGLGGPLTDEVIATQLAEGMRDLAHPLNGMMSQSEIMVMQQQADKTGMDRYLAVTDPDDVPENIDARVAAASPYSMGAFMLELESRYPGKAEELTAWWASQNRQELGARYIRGKAMTQSNDITSAIGISLISEDIQPLLANLANQYQQGYDMYRGKLLADMREDYMQFNGSLVNKQIYLLNETDGLSDTDKQLAAQSIILPLMDKVGQALELDLNAISPEDSIKFAQEFERQLRLTQFDDPAIGRLQRSILADRQNTTRRLQDFRDAMNLPDPSTPGMPGVMSRVREDAVSSITYDWWTKIQAEGL